MQNATVKQINSVIESYLTSQTMFTAYDVTKGVRSQGLHVMHADVKEALDTYNWRNRYTRTHNRNVNAFVYHEPMTNPDNYDPNAIQNVPVSNTNTSNSTIGMSGTVGNTGTVSASTLLDKRGRFTVSRNFIRDAGLNLRMLSRRASIGWPCTFGATNGARRRALSTTSKSMNSEVEKWTLGKQRPSQ